MSSDNCGWESSLSLVGNETTRTIRPRQGVTLLRPVLMNAVEVGYSYAHCDRDKKLNVRGVTIALWHFICRGHQAIALLPYCFKNYAEKSSRYSELMMLYRLNLIEFTPGYGSEKYTEVNRIMVNRAYETGSCIVARSQMQGITDKKANLIDVVEQRLLMPTFNGDDIMFPIDGPLGRNGPTLKQTLECEPSSPDWRICSEHQLLYSDQKHWMEKLSQLVPEKSSWVRMNSLIQNASLSMRTTMEHPFATPPQQQYQSQQHNEQPGLSIFPPDNSYQRVQFPQYHQAFEPGSSPVLSTSSNRLNDSPSSSYCIQPSTNYRKSNSAEFLHQQRSPRNLTSMSSRSRRKSSKRDTTSTQRSDQSCGSTGHVTDCSCFDVAAVNSDGSSTSEDMMELVRQQEEWRKMEMEQTKNDEILAKLSQIFGYKKSSRVMRKYPNIRNLCQLVEKCIQEENQDGDEMEFEQVNGGFSSCMNRPSVSANYCNDHEIVGMEDEDEYEDVDDMTSEESNGENSVDLIDFSEEQSVVVPSVNSSNSELDFEHENDSALQLDLLL